MTARPLIDMPHGVEAYSVAQREFDAVNSAIRRHVEAAEARNSAAHAEEVARFELLVSAQRVTDSQEASIRDYLVSEIDNGDVARQLIRLAVKSGDPVLAALATHIRDQAAEAFADQEI